MTLRERALSSPDSWQAALGLLPVYLRPPTGEEQARYVLLNGSAGNFCLDLSRADLPPKARVDSAWSCNVGSYVSILDDQVDVVRWSEPQKVERYTLQSVTNNLTAFHNYLERNTPEYTQSVVSFYSRAFRRLRANFPATAGHDALQAFLLLLACALENTEDISRAPLASWGLPESALDAARSINAGDLQSSLQHIAGLGTYRDLTPEVPLVFRHAAGMIFQDAHRIAETPLQTHLPGFATEAVLQPLPASAVGVHFTPPTIARTLAEEAVLGIDLLRPEIVALDPACGSGELLKELIRMLERQGYTGTLKIHAFDISAAAVDMSRFCLAFEQRNARQFKIQYDVKTADALSETWPAVDIAILNPPFRRWNDLNPEQQELLESVLGIKASRHNLATAFISRATDVVKDGGVIAAIAPRAFFESDAAREVREKISSVMSPKVVARLGSQDLFRDILVDAGIFVGLKASASWPAVALWADQTSSSTSYALRALRRRHIQEVLPIAEESYSLYHDATIGRSAEPWAPRRYSAKVSQERATLNKMLIPASRLFNIKQGARMGSDVFIVNREYLQSLDPEEQRFFRPAVLNQSIRGGVLNDNLYAFFPETKGLPELNSERDLLTRLPRYSKEYLLPAQPQLTARRSLSDQARWWEMIRRREWQEVKTPKLVSTYFGGVGSFAWDDKGEFVVVVGHAWLPKQEIENPRAYGRLLAIYLNLPETEDLIDALSVRVSGGQLDLSSKYLKNLLIPNIKKLPAVDMTSILNNEDPVDENARTRVRGLLGLVPPQP